MVEVSRPSKQVRDAEFLVLSACPALEPRSGTRSRPRILLVARHAEGGGLGGLERTVSAHFLAGGGRAAAFIRFSLLNDSVQQVENFMYVDDQSSVGRVQ